MAVTKITKLTDAQRDRMASWAREWIDRGLSTQEADWQTFEAEALRCYDFAKIKRPPLLIRVQSPIVGALAASVAASVIYKMRNENPGSAVDSAVDSAVHSAVHSAVYSAVGSAVYSAVDSAVYSAVGSAVDLFWHYWFGGSFWAGWHAYESFFIHFCDLQLTGDLNERAVSYRTAQMSAGYWWPNKDFIIVSDRPKLIHRDDRGRLHNESGNSIQYRDGWGLYHLHGVAVPRKYIEPEPDSIDPKSLLKESNAQVRMAVIGKLGFARMIRHLKTKEISRGPGSDKLISIDLGEQSIRALHLTWDERDGMHETVLPVPSRRDQFGADCPHNIDDFEQVRRWTLGWGMDVNIVAES